jgi:hypothetical protein
VATALGFVAGVTWVALFWAWLFSIAAHADAAPPRWLNALGALHPLLATVCVLGSPFAIGVAVTLLVDWLRKTRRNAS